MSKSLRVGTNQMRKCLTMPRNNGPAGCITHPFLPIHGFTEPVVSFLSISALSSFSGKNTLSVSATCIFASISNK